MFDDYFRERAIKKLDNYKEVRGTLVKKYCNLFRQSIVVFDENGIKTKIHVGRGIFCDMQIGTKWTIGHIEGKLINIRPGICKNEDE